MVITQHRLFPTLHGQDGQAQLTLYTKQHLVQRSKITVADFPWFRIVTTQTTHTSGIKFPIVFDGWIPLLMSPAMSSHIV